MFFHLFSSPAVELLLQLYAQIQDLLSRQWVGYSWCKYCFTNKSLEIFPWGSFIYVFTSKCRLTNGIGHNHGGIADIANVGLIS